VSLTPAQEQTILDIGGEWLLEQTRARVDLLLATPKFRMPTTARAAKQLTDLRKALAKVSPELRAVLSAVHAHNARHYGFGGDLPEAFDVVAYLDALAKAARVIRQRGNQRRHDVVLFTRVFFVARGLPLTDRQGEPLMRYLTVMDEVLDIAEDIRQLAREVMGRD
jgi:hypothetical protein